MRPSQTRHSGGPTPSGFFFFWTVLYMCQKLPRKKCMKAPYSIMSKYRSRCHSYSSMFHSAWRRRLLLHTCPLFPPMKSILVRRLSSSDPHADFSRFKSTYMIPFRPMPITRMTKDQAQWQAMKADAVCLRPSKTKCFRLQGWREEANQGRRYRSQQVTVYRKEVQVHMRGNVTYYWSPSMTSK